MPHNQRVRVRFAPSPTGPLHIGGVRTALYNYLFARKHGGDFLLRIEDTDSQRYVPGSEEYIIESLKWCGINVDEGVGADADGPYAPYRQSERKDIYLRYAMQLVDSGNAYFAFDTAEDLNTLRKEKESGGETFSYDASVRNSLVNSLSLPASEVDERIKGGDNWVIRFKMPENEEVMMTDLIRGDMTVNTSTLDDKVLFKSADGLPTYHLANIVDDHLMEISHVIRGEEWLPSLPLHYLLYKALGWEGSRPEFAHLPLLLKPQGQGKLSKRDGDKLGFPVFPLLWKAPDGEISSGYREAGYFPEAFVNMLALLGWNPGTEQEIFTMEELVEAFSLDRVGKAGARFNPDKARWFNAHYLHEKSDEELAELFLPVLKDNGVDIPVDRAAKAVGLIKERATFVGDMWELTRFMFFAPEEYDEKALKKSWNEGEKVRLEALAGTLREIESFDDAGAEERVRQWITASGNPIGKVMNVWRIAVLGTNQGPNIFAISAFIGKDETLKRIDRALLRL